MMSPGTDAVEQTIRTRRAFLAALRGGPQRKRDLVDALETSRSTVDRAVSDLAAAGLVTETHDGVKITLAGRMAVEIDGTYQRRIDELADGITALGELDGDLRIDDGFLADARIEAASPHVPDMVFDRFYESVAAAPWAKLVVPTVLREHIVRFGEEMRAQQTAVQVVIDTQVLDVLLDDPAMAAVLDTFVESEHMAVFAASLPVSFGVWETPEEAGVIVYTDTGPHSVLVNSRCAARRWARAVYEEAAADAEPIAHCRERRES